MPGTLPLGFGDGWMSRNAADLCRIIAFTELTGAELMAAVQQVQTNRDLTVTVATVTRAMVLLAKEKGKVL